MRYSSSLPFFFEDPGESFEENHLSERNSYRTATLIHTYIHTLHTYIHTLRQRRLTPSGLCYRGEQVCLELQVSSTFVCNDRHALSLKFTGSLPVSIIWGGHQSPD